MAIDESAGVLSRKDAVVKSSGQSRALAVLLRRHPVPCDLLSHHPRTVAGLLRRGWAEARPAPEVNPWAIRYILTDAGRAVAEASPAVREWIEGWDREARR
jgi:hypothetical protein